MKNNLNFEQIRCHKLMPRHIAKDFISNKTFLKLKIFFMIILWSYARRCNKMQKIVLWSNHVHSFVSEVALSHSNLDISLIYLFLIFFCNAVFSMWFVIKSTRNLNDIVRDHNCINDLVASLGRDRVDCLQIELLTWT